MQQTYFMIKPEIVAAGDQKVGAILAIANAAGFRITGLQMKQLDRPLIEEFYGGWQPGYVPPQILPEPFQTGERRVDVVYPGRTVPLVRIIPGYLLAL